MQPSVTGCSSAVIRSKPDPTPPVGERCKDFSHHPCKAAPNYFGVQILGINFTAPVGRETSVLGVADTLQREVLDPQGGRTWRPVEWRAGIRRNGWILYGIRNWAK